MKLSKQPQTSKAERDIPGLMFREAVVEVVRSAGTDGGAAPSVRISVSSETPVFTRVCMKDQEILAFEILDHAETSIDRSRCADGLVIQDCHYGDQIGLIRAPMVSDRKLGGVVEFCAGERACNIAEDAAKGLRRNVSVGYRCDPSKYVVEGSKDGYPLVRSLSWCPHEASFVTVPADVSVGVGRSLETLEPAKAGERISIMEKEKVTVQPEQVVEIYRLARAFGMEQGNADDHIRAGGSVEEFRALTLKKAEEDNAKRAQEAAKKEQPAAKRDPLNAVTPDLQREIDKRFSVMNVLRHLEASRKGERSGVDVGFETEVSKEVERVSGRKAQGIYIPHSAPVYTGKRADPFLKGANGSNFVSTNLLVGQFIDALRSRMVLDAAGVTTLSGLVGDVAIPKGGTVTGNWIDGENGAGTEGKPTVTQITGTPKTASGWTDISRRLMLQSSIDCEAFVQGELMNTIARLIEVAAFAGTNANGQPKGLKGWANVNNPTVTANTPTRAQMLAFISDILTDNAEFPNQSWIMRANGMALLADTANGSQIIKNIAGNENVGGGPIAGYLLDMERKQMLGFSYRVSTNVPAHNIFFGAWQQMVIGLWSGVDLTVDPYSNSTSGAVRVVALQDADIMVRHGEAFAYSATLTA